MNKSSYPNMDEIMRCITDGGPSAGLHLAALERQKSARMSVEQHVALKAASGGEAPRMTQRWTFSSLRNRASHWLGGKLISAGQHMAEST